MIFHRKLGTHGTTLTEIKKFVKLKEKLNGDNAFVVSDPDDKRWVRYQELYAKFHINRAATKELDTEHQK